MTEFNPEDMSIIDGLDLPECTEYISSDIDLLLTTCGTFNTKDCTGCEDLCSLLKPKGDK